METLLFIMLITLYAAVLAVFLFEFRKELSYPQTWEPYTAFDQRRYWKPVKHGVKNNENGRFFDRSKEKTPRHGQNTNAERITQQEG